jgi:hypothetical protein
MLVAAFDASGREHDQIALVVAGFISSANDWLEFERLWTMRLARDGIAHFHTVEFAHSFGQFDGWRNQEERRRELLSDLLTIIMTHCYRKFGCGISIKHWSSGISDSNKQQFRITAYGLAGLISILTVDSWCRIERMGTAPEIIFEDGDLGKGSLEKAASPRKPQIVFRPKKDTMRKDGVLTSGFVPLQAADMLAYELLLGIRNMEEGMPRDPRYALRQFYNVPGEIKWMEPKNFRELDEMLRVRRVRIFGA